MADSETKPQVVYRIETERCVVRCYEPRDAALLKDAVDEAAETLLPWLPWAAEEPQTLDQKVALMRRFRSNFDRDVDYVLGIFDPNEERLLGGTGLHIRRGPEVMEIGYWLRPSSTGQGLVTETTSALVRVAFEHHCRDRVEVQCETTNTRSQQIPRRLGFQLEATRKRVEPRGDGTYIDVQYWVRFRADHATWPHKNIALRAFDALGRQVL